MKKHLFFILLPLVWFCNQKEANTSKTQENIILFLVDDLGWQDTSEPFRTFKTANNHKYIAPHMESLASQGIKFTQTNARAICSPTRVSLISGMNAARHRVTNWI